MLPIATIHRQTEVKSTRALATPVGEIIRIGTCAICASSTHARCANCDAAHCRDHMLESSCPGCASQLFAIECRQSRWVTSAMGIVAIPIFAIVMMLSLSGRIAFLGFSALAVGFLGLTAVAAATRPLLRRRLARKKFAPTSRPALPTPLAPVAAVSPADAAYQARRRHNRRARPAKVAILGSCYKI